jgi:hypothetical protein
MFRSLALGRAREYYHVVYILAPFSFAPTSFDTTSTLTTLHLESNGHFPLFFKDYEPNQDLELSSSSFKLTFQQMPHLSASGPFGMVFKQLQDCFSP